MTQKGTSKVTNNFHQGLLIMAEQLNKFPSFENQLLGEETFSGSKDKKE